MLSWFWLITQMSRSDELLTLHHNILFGVDYIGPLWKAYYVPTLGLSIIVLNAVLGWLLYRKDTFMAQLLNIIALFASIFVFIATYMIVYWNI